MIAPELIQITLGLLAVGGIGGIWFRLGSLTAKMDGLDRRVSKLELQQRRVIL